MTLQYRIRSKYQDQLWRQRVYLCELRVADANNRWCRSEEDFPIQRVVAGVLLFFSPRCEPFEISPDPSASDWPPSLARRRTSID